VVIDISHGDIHSTVGREETIVGLHSEDKLITVQIGHIQSGIWPDANLTGLTINVKDGLHLLGATDSVADSGHGVRIPCLDNQRGIEDHGTLIHTRPIKGTFANGRGIIGIRHRNPEGNHRGGTTPIVIGGL